VQPADPLHTPWPERKLREVETRAVAGDKNAAWELAMYYGLTLHDERREDEWRHRAAVLRHPEAERWAACMIRRDVTAFAPHGDTPQRAVEKLLLDACVEQGHGTSCYDLAEAFEAGYFGETDVAAARAHYERGAELGGRAFGSKARDGAQGFATQKTGPAVARGSGPTIEADEAGLRMEPRRSTQCWAERSIAFTEETLP
jgi:hypothetical protein